MGGRLAQAAPQGRQNDDGRQGGTAIGATTATVDDRLRAGTEPRRRFPHQCFAKAMDYVLAHHSEPGLRLVHGTYDPLGAGLALPHAWVEIGEVVAFDPVEQRFFDRAAYYEMARAVPQAVYGAKEAARLMFEQDSYGPWHEERFAWTAERVSGEGGCV